MAEIYQLPDSNSGNMGGLPFSIPIGGLGNGGGLFGNGNNTIGELIGLAIVASIFGWGNGGFGFGGNGNMGGAGFISNQLNNDSGRELIMNAITSNGEASRAAIQNLATMLGQDYATVNGAIQSVQNSLNQVANAQGMSTLQVINAIQNGNCQLANQFSQCCCENKLLVTQQGYESQIATLNQTNQLGSQADRNTNSVINAINAQTVAMNDQFCALKEREMQAKIDMQADTITQLRGQIDNAQQTAQITGYVNTLIAPLQAKVTEIADKQPQTVPVQWPQLTAVNTTPYVNGGYYSGYGYYGGNGFGGNIVF
jgi:cellobiose-specific phosphotransferase system component IIA